MALISIGINHRTAPLAVREAVAFHPEELTKALNSLLQADGVVEAVILSTCNRTELYCVAKTHCSLLEWLASYRRLSLGDLESCCYELSGSEVVSQSFKVACGLDSMVLGEPQILGQVKQATRLARDAGSMGATLNKLFETTFAVAKDVRSTTEIGSNVVSMAAAAVKLAERIFEDIKTQRVLFIGAGEMIELCAAHFVSRNPLQIVVANRTIDRGRALADRFNAAAIRLEDLGERLAEFDIIVTCTASQLPIIGLGLVERALRTRKHKPVFIVDLAVPRDIEPEAGDLDDVFLYTVDDLAQIVQSGMESRRSAIEIAEKIIDERVAQFLQWLQTRDSVPLIRLLRDTTERMRRHELENATKRLAKGDDAQTVLEQLSVKLTNKFLHAPTYALNQVDENRPELQAAAVQLFRLHWDGSFGEASSK